MNIYQKLIEVRKSVPYLQKSEKGFQFNYVSSSQVLGNLKAKMDELGLLLIPSVISKEISEHLTAKGAKEYFTELVMEFLWVNADDPSEQIRCPWYGQGLDNGEKGVGKALTYSEKYFLLKFFNIPTDKDDPDSFQKKHEDEPVMPKGNYPPKVNNSNTSPEIKCSTPGCGTTINEAIKTFSEKRFGKSLCMICQKKEGQTA